MSSRTLEVLCSDRLAGALSDTPLGLSFAYAPTWIAGGGHPLSQSLPLDGDFGPAQVGAFFGGLLPEGPPRQLLARQRLPHVFVQRVRFPPDLPVRTPAAERRH